MHVDLRYALAAGKVERALGCGDVRVAGGQSGAQRVAARLPEPNVASSTSGEDKQGVVGLAHGEAPELFVAGHGCLDAVLQAEVPQFQQAVARDGVEVVCIGTWRGGECDAGDRVVVAFQSAR